MDNLSIICNFTDFGSSWYGVNNKDFTETLKKLFINCCNNIHIEWDNIYETDIITLIGKTFAIRVNSMNCPGHFCNSEFTPESKKIILTNVINYEATKDASLVRIPYGDPGMRLYGEYDDEGLFSDTEYMNQPACLALEIANMSLRMLGDYNEEAKTTLIDIIKNILTKYFGYKDLRVDQEIKKALDKKVPSGIILEEVFDEFMEVRSR